MKVRINRNTETKNDKKTVVNFDKDMNSLYKEIIQTTPIDVNFATITAVCKDENTNLDVTFSCIAYDLIDKYIDIHSVAEKYKSETGLDVDDFSVEMMFFILYMNELYTRYDDFLEKRKNYSKEISDIMSKNPDKVAKLYNLSSAFLDSRYNNK